jgi:hypothetical protein
MLSKFVIGAGLVAAAATAAFAWQSGKDTEAEMMAKWTAFATPGEAHHLLDPKVGQWTMKVIMYMPGAPPMESTGTSEMKWILDGRYLEDTTEGSFQGMPFHGRGLTAYDNLKKTYVTSWVDNMGTGISTGEGTWDAASKSFRYSAETPDVLADKYVPARTVETLVDADHWTVESFSAGPDGKEMKMMRIEYARAQAKK